MMFEPAGSLGVIGGTFVSALFSGTPRTPTFAENLVLNKGTYYVFEDQSDESSDGIPLLSPGDVVITAPNGASLRTYEPTVSQPRFVGGTQYVAVVGFDTIEAGTYHVFVSNPEPGFPDSDSVVIAPSFGTVAQGIWGWVAGFGIGGLVALGGLIGLIVAASRRREHRRRAAVPPTCTNGHPVSPTAQFCASCGAPVVRSDAMGVAR